MKEENASDKVEEYIKSPSPAPNATKPSAAPFFCPKQKRKTVDGRLKDYLRIGVFLQHDKVNSEELQRILDEHNLAEKWKENINKFQV